MHLLRDPAPGVVHRTETPVPPIPDGADVATTIRTRGILRVGYLPDSLPYAFFNARGELVGFDVELAHQLAREMGVKLELVPVSRERFDEHMLDGYCDLVMSGFAVTTDRASRTMMSNSYLDETLAFIVPDESREQFATWADIRAARALKIAVPNLPYYIEKLKLLVPAATIEPVADFVEVMKSKPADIDAIALPAERGSAWTLIYPAFSVIVPEPGIVKIPLSYPIARHDQAFAAFINTWIDLKKKDGTLDSLYQVPGFSVSQTQGPRSAGQSFGTFFIGWIRSPPWSVDRGSFLAPSTLSFLSRVYDDGAVLHDPADACEQRVDAGQRVALDRDEVGQVARCDAAEAILEAQHRGRHGGRGGERLLRRHPGLDEPAELARVLAEHRVRPRRSPSPASRPP